MSPENDLGRGIGRHGEGSNVLGELKSYTEVVWKRDGLMDTIQLFHRVALGVALRVFYNHE